MARNKNNNVTKGLSGKLGDVVFRQSDGETFASRPRRASLNVSPGQQAVRDKFKRASAYANGALADPDIRAVYESKATGRRSAYTIAVTDYLKPAVFLEVQTIAYDGSIGSKVRVAVTSIGRIVGLKLRIEDAAGNLVEEGAPVQVGNSETWVFTAKMLNAAVAGSTIRVRALDLPGHISETEIKL